MEPKPSLSVRQLREDDIDSITDYWLHADQGFLVGMGVDVSKMPGREQWKQMLLEQIRTPIPEKKSFCMIWEVQGRAAGHCNINKIIFGEEAYMHLHIWDPQIRRKGYGAAWIRMTTPHFFELYQLKILYCEPYAQNPAPNRTLEKAGFRFLRTYRTVPGWINYEQDVNLWELLPGDEG